MGVGDSSRFVQVLAATEPTFANLGLSPSGTPCAKGMHTPGGSRAAGVSVANPEFSSNFQVAENEETRNRPYSHSPVLTVREGTVSADIYCRGNGDPAEVFTDPVFRLYNAIFGISRTHAVQHDVSAFNSVTEVEITDAYADGLRVGDGFSIVLPTGKTFVGFVQEIAQSTTDTVTFDPPLTAAELTACQAESAGSVKLRGGRTYALGTRFAAASSVYFLLLGQAHAHEVFGAQGNTFDAELTAGEAGVFKCAFMGAFAHEGGYAPSMAISAWGTPDRATVSSAAGLRKGMFANVTTTESPAGTYLVRIREIVGTTVYFEPTGLPAGITSETPVPGLSAVSPGATEEPSGAWLTFLNGRCWFDGEYRDIRTAKWSVALNPQKVPSPNAKTGAVAIAQTYPEVTCEIELSSYDDGAQFQNFQAGVNFSVLCMLGDGTVGNAVALYSPAMHNADAPEAGEADDMTTLPIMLRTGLPDTDAAPYNGTTPESTTFRLFVAW